MPAWRQTPGQLCNIGQKLARADGRAILPGDNLLRSGMGYQGNSLSLHLADWQLIALCGMLHKCAHGIQNFGFFKVGDKQPAHSVFNDEHERHQGQENKIGKY